MFWYRRKYAGLLKIARTLGSSVDQETLLGTVLEQVTDLMEADRSTLYLVDSGGGQLWSRVLQGDETFEIRLDIGQGIAGWVASTGTTVNIEDVLKDDRFDSRWDKKSGYRTRTMLCVAMRNAEGTVVGVIQVLNKARGVFDHNDEALLEAVGFICASAVENAALKRELAALQQLAATSS